MSSGLVPIGSKQPSGALAIAARQRMPTSGSFRTGQSGNPGGRPKSAYFRKLLLKRLQIEVAQGLTSGEAAINSIVDKVITEADVSAFTAIRDTVDGKPQSNDTGSTGIQIQIAIEAIST
jgi:Family of unknown function (DUF5681)